MMTYSTMTTATLARSMLAYCCTGSIAPRLVRCSVRTKSFISRSFPFPLSFPAICPLHQSTSITNIMSTSSASTKERRVLGISEPLDFSPAQRREIDAIVSEYNLVLRQATSTAAADESSIGREGWMAFVNDCDYVISGKQGLSAKLIHDGEEMAGTEGIYHVAPKRRRDGEGGGENNNALVISHPFVNVAWIDKARLTGLGITLLYAPGCNRDAVSEWVVHSALSLFRKLHTCANVRSSIPRVRRGRSIANKIAVILGKGAVGTRCGMVLSAMKMNVRYLERDNNDGDMISLRDLVRDADLVVNCLSSSSSNANILNADFFNVYMPRGSTFISMTNPIIYDIDGLLSALSTERIYGAAIDIGNTYPGDVRQTNYAKFMNFLNTHPEYENVLLVTPQVAHFADASQSTSFDMAIENIRYAVEDKLDRIPDRVWNIK